jgi:hypothetical protein
MNFERIINQIIEDEYRDIWSEFYRGLNVDLNEEQDCITPTIIILPLLIQGIKNNYMFKCL